MVGGDGAKQGSGSKLGIKPTAHATVLPVTLLLFHGLYHEVHATHQIVDVVWQPQSRNWGRGKGIGDAGARDKPRGASSSSSCSSTAHFR